MRLMQRKQLETQKSMVKNATLHGNRMWQGASTIIYCLLTEESTDIKTQMIFCDVKSSILPRLQDDMTSRFNDVTFLMTSSNDY